MTHYLITGANRGLGLEFVRQLLARGDSVAACCREPAKAAELNALGGDGAGKRLKIYPLDVADPAAIAGLPKKLEAGEVKVDVLINNAGVASGQDEELGEFEAETMERVLSINSVAPMLVSQAMVPLLEDKGKSPKIVCITSGLGSITQADGLAYGLSYGMSKAALNMGVKKLSSELKRRGIAIVALHPGWVQTDMGGANAPLRPPESIRGMLAVIDGLDLEQSGRFLNYAGDELPW
jgi:NAD(P)-dependent dehydrogenase (short-subunit alcohol dehydrogenase family)